MDVVGGEQLAEGHLHPDADLEPDDEDLSDQPGAAHLIDEPAGAVEPSAEEPLPSDEAEPAVNDDSPVDEPAAAEPPVAPEALAVADVPQADEESGALAEDPEPEDVPRRARPDEDARLSDGEDEPADDWPVFQKSATPYWTGAVTHAED